MHRIQGVLKGHPAHLTVWGITNPACAIDSHTKSQALELWMVTATNRVRNSVLSLLSATVIAAGVVAPVARAQQSPTGPREAITWEQCPPRTDMPRVKSR